MKRRPSRACCNRSGLRQKRPLARHCGTQTKPNSKVKHSCSPCFQRDTNMGCPCVLLARHAPCSLLATWPLQVCWCGGPAQFAGTPYIQKTTMSTVLNVDCIEQVFGGKVALMKAAQLQRKQKTEAQARFQATKVEQASEDRGQWTMHKDTADKYIQTGAQHCK